MYQGFIVVVMTCALVVYSHLMWRLLPPQMKYNMTVLGMVGLVYGLLHGFSVWHNTPFSLGVYGVLVVLGNMFQYWTIGLFIGSISSIATRSIAGEWAPL